MAFDTLFLSWGIQTEMSDGFVLCGTVWVWDELPVWERCRINYWMFTGCVSEFFRYFWGVELCGLGHVPVLRVFSPAQHTQWEWVICQHDTATSHQYIASSVKWINRYLRLCDLVSFMSLMWRCEFQSNFLLANMKSRLDWWMGAKWAITVNICFCHYNEVFVVSPTETLSVCRF